MARPQSGGQVPLPLKNISQISYNIICKNSRINPNNLNYPPKMVHRSTSVINISEQEGKHYILLEEK